MTLPAAPEKRTKYYQLQYFYLNNGTQTARIQEIMSQGLLPALNKVHAGPKLFLDALVAPHMPQMLLILGFSSLEEWKDVCAKLFHDGHYWKAFEAWEAGPEAPYQHYSEVLLEATGYSPEPAPLDPPPQTPRIFELRVYHSPTWRQLRALHERFAGSEIAIFQRLGIHPILYSSTLVGPSMPNLTYLIPFDSLAAREKAWAAFAADPEWIKVRTESIAKHGQISSVIQMALYRATPYSPIR
jgi:hypothetical protein